MTIGEIQNMETKELQMLNKMVVAELKARRTQITNKIKNELNVGQIVEVNHHKLFGVKCKITQINRKRVVVSTDRGNYTVPMSMLIVK